MKVIRSALIFSIVFSFAMPTTAKADDTRDFVMSCTYGVLAGTLVGAASLSFTNKPGDKLYRIARGASLGLYAGIILGWYVTSLDEAGAGGYQEEDEDYGVIEEPTLQVYPLVSDSGAVDGGAFKYSVLKF